MKHDSDILKRIKNYFMRRKSAQEAYEFERDIERDPFLYEAMEGFEDMLTSDIQQALDELDDRLDAKERRGGFIFTWQAAAIGLVIVAGTTVFAILGGQRNEADTAGAEEGKYAPRTLQRDFSAMDDEPEVAVSEEDSFMEAEVEDADYATQHQPIPPPNAGYALADDEVKEPAKEKNLDLKKAESSRTDETTMEIAAADEPTNYETERGAIETERKAAAVKSKVASEEIKMAPSQALTISESDASTSSSSPSPEGGMSAYRQYLKRNLQRSDGMPSGGVTLSFEFDKDGTPKKVTVVNSLCTACDAEAIRLIEAGPKWTAADRKERVTITVDF